MDPSPLPLWAGLTLVSALVLLNGCFVAAETAVSKVRGARLDALARQGRRRAAIAQRLLSNADAYLSACRLGMTLASLGLGWIGGPAIARWLASSLTLLIPEWLLHTLSFVLAFTLIAALHYVLGAALPRSYAHRKSEAAAIWTSLLFHRPYRILRPPARLLDVLVHRLLRAVGIDPSAGAESAPSEEDLRTLLAESNKNGHIDNTELALVHNVFDFTGTSAREIMIPRTEMVCLYADRPFQDNMRIVIENKHTRYPVCAGDKDNIVGMVHMKDLLEPAGEADLLPFIRPVTKVPASMPIAQLMKALQRRRAYMAVLIDEYGGTAGLVTFEDIIEELVGEVHDEFDESRMSIESKDEDSYSICGLLHIEDVNRYFRLSIDTEQYDTIGGWMYAQVDSPPRLHAAVTVGDFEFSVEETESLRISRILVRRRRVQPEPVRALGVG